MNTRLAVFVCHELILLTVDHCTVIKTPRLFQAAAEAAQFDDYRSQVVATSNPYFVTELRNITVKEGDTITLRCVASGEPYSMYSCHYFFCIIIILHRVIPI